MGFPKDSKGGRIKGLGGTQVIVRRYKNSKYNSYYELKDKVKSKADRGQCRITIPRAIADGMNLKDRDVLEFIPVQHGSYMIKKVDKDELE